MVALSTQQVNMWQEDEPIRYKSNEWFTPSKYVEAARCVMSSIDLDPASCEQANQVVKAERYYSKDDNGLLHSWHGNIWLNPPFSDEATTKGYGGAQQGATTFFVDKLMREYHAGNVKQAVLLVNAKHDVAWFYQLWDFPICFAQHKVRFLRPASGFESHMFGTVFVYLGNNEDRFIEVFSQFGTIARRVNPVVVQERPRTLWEVAV